MSNLYHTTMAALRPAREALARASAQYPSIVAAQSNYDARSRDVEAARQRVRLAQEAYELARTACNEASSGPLEEALAAARLEFETNAPAALRDAEAALHTAQQELSRAQQPVQHLINVCTNLDLVVSSNPGDLASHARRADAALELSIIASKAPYPNIAELERAESRSRQTAQEAADDLGHKQRANTAAQGLYGKASTDVNRKAAEATASALAEAESTKQSAEAAHQQAKAALDKALLPIKDQLDLQGLVAAVVREAASNDSSYHQRQAWEQQQAAEEETRESSRDPDCTCSIGENTCLHCIMKQQHEACGHNRERGMCD